MLCFHVHDNIIMSIGSVAWMCEICHMCVEYITRYCSLGLEEHLGQDEAQENSGVGVLMESSSKVTCGTWCRE